VAQELHRYNKSHPGRIRDWCRASGRECAGSL